LERPPPPPPSSSSSSSTTTTVTAAATNNLVIVIKRLGYDENYILIAIDACRQRWISGVGGGDAIPLDARIGDVLDELVKYKNGDNNNNNNDDDGDDIATIAITISAALVATPVGGGAAPIAVTTNNKRLGREVDTACKMCRNACVQVALLTCRHVCCCQPCAKKVMTQQHKRCPICNNDVMGTCRIYF
jgi:hypothetical protein